MNLKVLLLISLKNILKNNEVIHYFFVNTRNRRQAMRKVIVYIAMSIDGYIATNSGDVSWLHGSDENNQSEYDSYGQFLETIDTVIMGNTTYQQVINELSPDKWAYQGLQSYVFSHHQQTSKEEIIFINTDPKVLIEKLKKEEGKHIWICGGANIIQQLHQEKCIDEYHITIIPTILGDGIALFSKGVKTDVRLLKSIQDNGMIELRYKVEN